MIPPARVVQQQDRAVPPAQMVVQLQPPRSITKTLHVCRVLPAVIRPLIVERHYLRSMPAAAWRCFGIYAGERLAGAVVFTAGPRHGYRLLLGSRPQQVATLARLWLHDDLPRNSESRVIGIILRQVRHDSGWKLLLSYADPAAGHAGVIYKATGWLYLGLGAASRYIDLGDGRIVHPRTAHGVFGANNIGHLARTGIVARPHMIGGKHRYVYILDPAWRWRLRDAVLPYPVAGNTP